MKKSEIASTIFVTALACVGAHAVGTYIGNVIGRKIVTGEWRFSL